MKKNKEHIEMKSAVVAQLNIRNTRLRDQVIDFFLSNPQRAFTETEIWQTTRFRVDRVSVYRTIKTLIQKGFIHKVVCSSGDVRYVKNEQDFRSTLFLHFECVLCGNVYCLPQALAQPCDVPEGFKVDSFHYLIEGICNQCELKINP